MKKIAFCFAVLMLFMAMPALASQWYIDADNGSDTSSCGNETSPCQDVNYTLTQVQGGDTVFIAGTFTGEDARIGINSNASGTASAYTTITSWPGQSNPVFDLNGSEVAFALNNVDYLNLENLEIYDSSQMAVNVNNGSNIFLKNLKIYNNDQGGISVDSSSDVQIVDNMIYSNGSSEGSGVLIMNSSTVNVVNNSIYNNARSAEGAGFAAGIDLIGSTSLSIANNIISANDIGLQTDITSINEMELDYNDYFENQNGAASDGAELFTLAQWQETYNYDILSLDLDPLFTSTTEGSEDLHLQIGSPCIDNGTVITGLDTDYDNEIRPYGPAYDIGADEKPMLSAPIELSFDPKVRKLTLAWLMSSDYEVSGYEYDFGTTSDLSGLDTVTTTLTEAFDTVSELVQAKTYYYQVRAYYTDENSGEHYYSDYSDIATVTTKPKKVANLKVKKKNRKAKKVKATWKSQARVSFIWRLYNAKGTKKLKNGIIKKGKHSKWIKKLKPGKKYTLKMKARKKLDEERYKSPKWITKKFRTAVQ